MRIIKWTKWWGHEIVTAYGGRIALIDLVAGRSTTNLIAKMADGE